MNKHDSRRNFLKMGSGALGVAVLANPISKAIANACGLTPPQTAGPFYPGNSQFAVENDLTQVPGQTQRAEGQVIYVKGQVVDQNCVPIVGANVEIWQACHSGKYNNPKDTNPAKLDPYFRYWAETYTSETGEYWFKTIIPGAYPADDTWKRPPHLHFKITKLGFRELVTQMYFQGNPLNESDLILHQLSPAERSTVIVDFIPTGVFGDLNALVGKFDIALRSVRSEKEDLP